MRVSLLSTLPADYDRTRSWLGAGLRSLGHDVVEVDRPDLAPARAADLGYALARAWQKTAPDAVMALGWVAGLAAQVATREVAAPVLLHLPRVSRSGDAAVTRVERALVRSATAVLASTPSEAEALAQLGALRSRIRLLPEAIDPEAAVAADRATADEIVVAVDDTPAEVDAVLTGMAAGRPAVVVDRGILADLVADGVSGLVVPPHQDLGAAVRSLRLDPMRRESMGMAAVDRLRARFDVGVVLPALGRLLDEVQERALLTA